MVTNSDTGLVLKLLLSGRFDLANCIMKDEKVTKAEIEAALEKGGFGKTIKSTVPSNIHHRSFQNAN